MEHEAEILNVSPIDLTAPSWTRHGLSHDHVITWTKARVHDYSDFCLEKCQIIQKLIEDGMVNLKNFDSPILTENFSELMENRLSSSVIFCPGFDW